MKGKNILPKAIGLAIAVALTVGQAAALEPRNNGDWYKLDGVEFDCVNQEMIKRYGVPIELLDMFGIGPEDDKRIAPLRLKCRETMKRHPQGVPWPKMSHPMPSSPPRHAFHSAMPCFSRFACGS